MSSENHIIDLLPEYALGSLDADEARQVAEHLAGCYSCRQELDAYQQVADGLLFAVPEAMPSARLRSRLTERVRGLDGKRTESREPREERMSNPLPVGQPGGRSTPPAAVRVSRRLSFTGAFAGLALILLLAASNIYLWQRLNHPEYMTGPLGMKAVALQNTEAAPDGSAYAIVSGDGKNGVIVVDHLPPLDADHEYQVWLERDDTITAAGTFAVDEDGYRGMRLSAPDSLLSYRSLFVTAEPKGGSPAPTGAKVLSGSLFNK
jgi:anti-sigma-K factor RskA